MRDGGAAFFASDDDAHIAYQAIRGEHSVVGCDDTEYPYYGEASRSVPPIFSKGGEHLVYGVADGAIGRLVIDGRLADLGILAPIAAVYSPDGSRLAFAEQSPTTDGQYKVRVLVDDVPGPWSMGMRNAGGVMQFSPDSRRFAYLRTDGRGKCQWVVDGREQQLFSESREISLTSIRLRNIGVLEQPVRATFSPDSQRFVYFADVSGKGVAFVEDDSIGQRFLGLQYPVFSPDSRHLAYVAKMFDKNLALIVDDRVVGKWEAIQAGLPVFSADSAHVALSILRQTGGPFRKRSLVAATIDGVVIRETPARDISEKPAFSPDGMHLAWWTRDEDQAWVLVDGVEQDLGGQPIGEARFTSAGHLVCRVSTGPESETIVVDGSVGPMASVVGQSMTPKRLAERPGAAPDSAVWRVSADGKHTAWMGDFVDGVFPVLDGEKGPRFEDVISVAFEGDIATWYARNGNQMYAVTARV
ncbi:MAG TPA: hypothetical protein VMZ33_07205 [Candidatus Limnocylindrales bacterium]|nr:hypothetical protein [Candidatus Limnocylindrales bacterium]